ncbi:MAG: alpha-2-macroglobulin family protein, partial [Isosphaeraceae bacterium]
PYVLRLSGTDQFGNSVVAERTVMISGSKDPQRLRLLSDRLRFKVGERASVNLHARGGASTALIAWEADRILRYCLVPIKEGDTAIAWDVQGDEFPSITLTATSMAGDALDESRLDLSYDRDLRITVAPARPVVGPGDQVELEVTTRDQLGRPVAAELSLAMVDRALLARFGDTLPPIRRTFNDLARTGAFATRATNTFRYAPRAISVPAPGSSGPTRPSIDAPPVAQGRVEGMVPPFDQAPGRRRRPQAVDPSKDARNRAVLAILDEPVNMSFAAETSLDDVLRYIKQATARGDRPPLQIYVDPIGLQEAERSLNSTVQIDLEGVPLRTSMKLMLEQLGLAYRIEDGIVRIISQDSADEALGEAELARQADPNGSRGIGMGGMGGMGGGGMMGGMGAGMGGGRRGPVVAGADDEKDKAPAAAPADAPARQQLQPAAGKPPASKTAEDRAAFVETAYWNPSIVTDANGRARITFRAPTALVEYRVAALGVTGRETLVGDGTSILSIRKPFHIELKTPAILAEGDEPRLPVRIHHPGIKGRAKVTLEVVADGRTEVFPKDVDLADGGVTEVLLDAFRVPGAERVRLSVSASAGPDKAQTTDRLSVEVPVRAWGLPVFASASGRSSDDATAFVTLPAGRRYENPKMRIALSPRADRMLVELALNDSAVGFTQRPDLGCMPIGTTVERAGDLLGAAAALATLRDAPDRETDAAARLSSRIAGDVTELVSAQKSDGSWPWIPVAAAPGEAESTSQSDLLATARAVWALTSAEPLGQGADPSVLDKAAKSLEQALAGLDAGEFTLRAEVLHALALRGWARFETVNALVRNRQVLSDRTLALLAMTLARLDHAGAAEEVLDVLAARGRTEPTGPGRPPLRYWTDGVAPARGLPGSAVETTALAALAFARVRPGSAEAAGARAWLLAHRVGNGWIPAEARGLAIQALAAAPDEGRDNGGGGEVRYRLTITVNDTEVFHTEVNGPVEGREIEVPRKLLKTGAGNRVAFDIEGRGTFGYAVTLSGVTRDFTAARPPAGRNAAAPGPAAAIRRRAYLAAPPELDGRPLESGFAWVVHATPFENRATQVGRGASVRVEVEADRLATGRGETGGPVVIHEYLPAGTSVVPGSVGSDTAVDWIISDGLLTVFAPAGPAHVEFEYSLRGDVPGRYRILPTAIQAAEDPGRGGFGVPGELAVLAPGEPTTDVYRPTPDELFDRGERLFEAGRLADASSPLESLFEGYTLRDDKLKETARMLLYVDLARHDARRIVRDFEIVREKAPELVIAFETLLSVGRAYAEIGESERAYLGWTALVEASYLEDARIGELLRERGRDLEGIALLLKLWRETPGGPTVDADFLGLAQLIARTAPPPLHDGSNPQAGGPDNPLREERFGQSKRLTETFLAAAPGSPLVDEAGLALAADAYELGDREGMVRIAERFARVHPNGPLRDRFRYSEALGYFHLGQLDRAIAAARAIVGTDARTRAPADSRESAAVRTQALALLGRIHEARLEPAEALTYYRRIAARVVDAEDAVEALTARVLRVPEMTIIRPGRAGGKGRLTLDVTHRNLAELDVRVYPVDLLRLFGGVGNVRANPSADLAGIRPVYQSRLTLERGRGGVDLTGRERRVELPVAGEGAYLVMLRGDDQFASGLAVLTPLELEVTRTTEGGRIRVAVREAATGRGVPGAQVKVLGAQGPLARQGETDLRGVFVAEAVDGRITVVARSGAGRYALYRSLAEEDEDRNPAANRAASEPARRGEADDALRPSARKEVERRFQRMEKRGGMGGMGGGMMGGGFM